MVPILAPMITPTACDNFMIPEFTKPTTITVVAEDDWITAVTPAPKSTAFIGFEVRFSRIFSSFPPETFARPSPIAFIPYKNNARPPINVNILNKSMIILLFPFHKYMVIYFLPSHGRLRHVQAYVWFSYAVHIPDLILIITMLCKIIPMGMLNPCKISSHPIHSV